ncbi:16S rRNA (guanine(966)-N(2))-methyltransferase RsmD [Buchnera aphidicola]|uniref:16S rRNA (guanine(966)-N(2))-methyltransferase RsmD n=1 Tax=Buchnera aphidicola TaxID=9 RepID=UPI00346456E0
MNNNFIKKNNYVSIIAGKFKGKKIYFKDNLYLRPTTNRIRETLFNWLSKTVQNAICLDCFAGSGVLGIESISRNATHVTSLEIDKNTAIILKNNIKKLKINNLNVIHTNAIHWLKKNGTPYDIIFIDPPYSIELINETLILLNKNKWLKKNSMIYIEKNKKKILKIPENWVLYKKKHTSQIEYYLYTLNNKI